MMSTCPRCHLIHEDTDSCSASLLVRAEARIADLQRELEAALASRNIYKNRLDAERERAEALAIEVSGYAHVTVPPVADRNTEMLT